MKIRWKKVVPVAIGATAIIAAGFYGGFRYVQLRGENKILASKAAELQIGVDGLMATLASVRADLAHTQNENGDLAQNVSGLNKSLSAEQEKNKVFSSQIQEISGTVGTLKKLSELDSQLLKKYSRVYFLNENYAPTQLSSIPGEYLYDEKRTQLVHSGVLPYLEALLAASGRDGMKLRVISAYRSFYEQASLKSTYKIIYGSGANQFSADQGYSEHQLGTAVDFTTPEGGDLSSNFQRSSEYKWLNENAYKFGFVLSYPVSNTYYRFEPWHWRFVGKALAAMLHDKGEYFYNLAQRDIDAYLISIFD